MVSKTNKQSVCFISNYSKTYLAHEIAKRLKRDLDIKVVWLSVNEQLNNFLLNEYNADEVLYLSREYINKTTPPLENTNLKINELIYGDRVWRNEKESAQAYLSNIQQPIVDFFLKHNVRAVFGEITWAHELLVHRICKAIPSLKCSYLNPHVVRIPNGRFGFFLDEGQTQLFQLDEPCEDFGIFEVKKPTYVTINKVKVKKNQSLMGRLDRVKRFLTNENIDAQDPTHPAVFKDRTMRPLSEEWKKETYKTIKRQDYKEVNKAPYVFLGVHKQPEASIDVMGRYQEDQLMNILNLWRILPPNWNLLIKEHSSAIGDRGRAFYKELLKHPGIKLIHEGSASYEVIKNAHLIATVTGTMAYEAALMRIPSVTLAPTFFNQLNTCVHYSSRGLAALPGIEKLVEELRFSEDNRHEFCNYILKNTMEGNVLDPQTTATVLEEENLEALSNGFAKAIKKLTSLVEMA